MSKQISALLGDEQISKELGDDQISGVLGYEHLEYLRRLETARSWNLEPRSRTRPATPVLEAGVDRRWLSTGHLPELELQDRWWLQGSCKSFLETKGTSFGRKNVFLIQKKPEPLTSKINLDFGDL